jgi:hypothetical protein
MYENFVVFAIVMAFFAIEIIYELPIIQRCPYHMGIFPNSLKY